MVSSLIDIANIANTILNMPRIGWIQRGIPQAIAESVGDHILLTSYLALVLCNNARGVDDNVNADKCVTMALIHDIHEALTGNVGNSVRSLISDWKNIEVRLFNELQLPEELGNYFREYRYALSIEGKIVNLSDKLATLIRACMYARAGYDTRELIINYREIVERLLSEFTGDVGQVIKNIVKPVLSWCDNRTITNALSDKSSQ